MSISVATMPELITPSWRERARRGDRRLIVPGGLFLFYLLAALIVPLVWPWGANAIHLGGRLQAPSFAHPFGTDEFGRDMVARFFTGARLSMLVGLSSVSIGGVIGMVIGSVAGLSGGILDAIVMRGLDTLLAFPALILGIAIALAIGPGVLAPAIAVTVASIPWYARRVRSEVLSLKTRTFFDAEKLMGWGRTHVLWHHVFPAVIDGVVVQASLAVGYAVLTVAALGYIGLGVQPPTAEWGSMIADGQTYLLTGQWWLAVIPGIGLLLLVALTIRLGDALAGRLAYSV
jgi:peptide/nickel transport system permease protein